MIKIIKNNSAILIPIRAIAVILVIVIVLVCVYWFMTSEVTCDPENTIELTGLLRGFDLNGSYWNVKIGNESYVFCVFDRDYMKNMIGFPVVMTACFSHDNTFQTSHYNMINCYINEVE